jgi:citrate lyase subunit beta/citryl-CoA lyase
MLETPLAMLNAHVIAQAREQLAPSLSLFVIGTNDLAKETRVAIKPGRAAYLPWLMQCVAAARAYGVGIVDGVYNDTADRAGLEVECIQGRDCGMDGKTLIHPSQIETANRVFSPSPEEIEWAQRVCAAFDQSENANAGVLAIDGRMVERLHADDARRVLAFARATGAI